MPLPLYLAITAPELAALEKPPENFAYMACHFSLYDPGLAGIPSALPPGALLMLNDRTPIMGHDPQLIADQLARACDALQARGVVLDLQRPEQPLAGEIAGQICKACSVPVAVSELYAKELECAVFLKPVPVTVRPEDHLRPWQGRQIFLDITCGCTRATVDHQGCRLSPAAYQDALSPLHRDENLLCHYHTALEEQRAVLTIYRSREDLDALLERCAPLGVSCALGLYQEFGQKEKPL